MLSSRLLFASMFTGATLLAATAAPAAAQVLPTPKQLATSLDLECYPSTGPSLDLPLTLSQLNPVLVQLGLPAQQVVVRELSQTCVPVMKNNTPPIPAAAPFVRHIDFACYRVDAQPLAQPQPVALTHINPVLANLPQHGVQLTRAAHLCLPVRKNNQVPPAAVAQLVRYLDLLCYDTLPAAHPQFAVNLTQLNPLLGGIAPHVMTLIPQPRQLCVPVRKNNQAIPAAELARIRWIDLERFKAQPNVAIAPVPLTLHHLNPLLVGQPPVNVVLQQAASLLVPVAKNNQIPPD